jgi:hypothetical protein
MRQSSSSINYQLGSLYSVITAFLYATQEPFSFPAATHLSTLQFVALTQISLLVSLPLLTGPPASRPAPKTRQLRVSDGHLCDRDERPPALQLRP